VAYAKIASARFSGQKRQFTFDQYVEMHQDAHNTLEDLNEPIPETKKVTDFLSGVTNPRLMNAKDLILGDPAKLQDFEACQQYLKTLIYKKAIQDKHERNMSGIATNPKGGKQNKERGKQDLDQGDKSNKDVLVWNYTKEEWFKLSKEQCERIKDARNAKKDRREEQAQQAASVVRMPPPPAPAPPAPTIVLGPATGINTDWIRDVASAVT
jgi:hypothetical protein